MYANICAYRDTRPYFVKKKFFTSKNLFRLTRTLQDVALRMIGLTVHEYQVDKKCLYGFLKQVVKLNVPRPTNVKRLL
jgi:hypothetical protein